MGLGWMGFLLLVVRSEGDRRSVVPLYCTYGDANLDFILRSPSLTVCLSFQRKLLDRGGKESRLPRADLTLSVCLPSWYSVKGGRSINIAITPG